MNLSTPDRTREDTKLSTADELGLLEIGSHVCLSLKGAERFWVRVVEIRKAGTYKGIAIASVKPVKKGDVCIFEKAHIFGIV